MLEDGRILASLEVLVDDEPAGPAMWLGRTGARGLVTDARSYLGDEQALIAIGAIRG